MQISTEVELLVGILSHRSETALGRRESIRVLMRSSPAIALREGLEESGLPSLEPLAAELPFDIDIHTIPARKTEPAHEHFDVRYAFQAPHRDFVVSPESHDLAWVPIAELRTYTQDASVLRMAHKWLTRR